MRARLGMLSELHSTAKNGTTNPLFSRGSPMTVLHDCNALERDALFQLAALSDASGHDLGDALDEAYASGMTQSRVYQILKSLRRDGLVEKRKSEGYGSAYILTKAGHKAVQEYYEWASERVPEE